MTNEELAILIQQGHEEHLPELWDNTKRLLHKLTFQLYRSNIEMFDRAGLSLEDLKQESYFALLGAVKAYNPEKGFAFNSYLHLQLKRHIRAILKPGDLLNRAETRSLDAPLDTEEEDSDSLHDITPDPESGKAIAAFEERESYNLLHEAISLLPGGLKEVIKLHFFEGLTLDQIGERLGKSRERIRQIENNALATLRRGPISRKLKDAYLDDLRTNHSQLYYRDVVAHHKGVSSFLSSHSSEVEDAVLRREALLNREITRCIRLGLSAAEARIVAETLFRY